MKTFIKILAFFLATFLSISSVFAYDLNVNEKYQLDAVVQKLETSISIKGESYRSIYISRLTDAKAKLYNYKIIAYVDYLIDSLNISSIFNGIYDQNCSPTTKYINGHAYYLSALSSGNAITRNFSSDISNGYDVYKQVFSCNNGVFSPIGSEEYISTTCNSNYILSGRNCYYSPIQNCIGTYKYYNGYSSYLDYLYSGSSKQISFNIGNGNRYITYRCYNGTTIEDYAYTTCNSGYVLNGGMCYYNQASNNCIYTPSFLVGTSVKHSYIVPAFNANTYTTQSVKLNVVGGIKTFSQNFYCSNGKATITENSPEKLVSFICNSGYKKSSNGLNCDKIQNSSCSAHVQNVNGHAYNIPYKASGTTQNFYYNFNINGISLYQQNFSCNNGVTSKIGSETIYSCMSTHDLINGKCVLKSKPVLPKCLGGSFVTGTSKVNGISRAYFLENTINSGEELTLTFNQASYIVDEPNSTQKFQCNVNGVLVPVGTEIFTCKSGYSLKTTNNTCVQNLTKGTYKAYLDFSETPFIVTNDISRSDALSNCMLNHSFNSNSSIRCTWNLEEIYIYVK